MISALFCFVLLCFLIRKASTSITSFLVRIEAPLPDQDASSQLRREAGVKIGPFKPVFTPLDSGIGLSSHHCGTNLSYTICRSVRVTGSGVRLEFKRNAADRITGRFSPPRVTLAGTVTRGRVSVTACGGQTWVLGRAELSPGGWLNRHGTSYS